MQSIGAPELNSRFLYSFARYACGTIAHSEVCPNTPGLDPDKCTILDPAEKIYFVTWTDELRYMSLYHLFGLFWTTQFFIGFAYTVIAGAVANVYWCSLSKSKP